MDNTLFKTGLRFYQSANADAAAIKEEFIIRKHEYAIIMDDIRRNISGSSVQHYLLLGRRGSGKSTLLKRIQVEIDADETLQAQYFAINLAEEQANIYRLFDLLEEIINELHHSGVEAAEPLWHADPQEFARRQFAAIHSVIAASGKKLVLLLDNINRIFENLHDDAALLREYLLNYDDIKIIGGSTRMTEHFWKYNKPFYEFFRVLELKPLTSAEVKELLLYWGEKWRLPQLKEFIEKKPGQLETIRILTDGLPRTLQFFVSILINKTDASGYEYLKQIMDYITPLYQERLNGLPPSQRKIVLQMAFIWESAGAKELAEATRMDTKVISAQLKQLTDKGIAEKQETATKNHLYRLSERFFNLWLIFTQGSPQEKRRARYLTIFLENFYDEEELRRVAEEHVKCLEDGVMLADKAAMLTKAYAQSKFISSQLRDLLIKKTLQLSDINAELKTQLPSDTDAIWSEIAKLIAKKQWNNAIKKAEEIEQSDGAKEFMLGFIHYEMKDYPNSEKYYLFAAEHGLKAAFHNLALMYDTQKKYDLSEKYYLLAIKNGDVEAMNNLAILYQSLKKFDHAEKSYLLAIEKGHATAKYNLAVLYDTVGKTDLAEKFYLLSLEKDITLALNNLSLLYYTKNKQKERALNLIERYNKIYHSDRSETLSIVLKGWNGIFDGIYDNLAKFIRRSLFDFIPGTFEHLLIHHQKNIINKLFHSSEFGEELKKRFLPQYYATQILVGGDANIELKIPPELQEIVDTILKQIERGQKFYYGAKEKATD